MSAKILISGQSNSGKTTLTKTLKDALVISHDGKNFPFPIAHKNVASFQTATEFNNIVIEAVNAYEAKFGELPKTIVYDSVSKIFDTIMDICNTKHTGFKIYSELNKEIHEITDFVQNQLVAAGMNVVIISHAIWDGDTSQYNLIGKGDFSKRGGFLSETDNAIFVETKNNKRIVHHRSTKFPARTILTQFPDSVGVEEYSLQDHIDLLVEVKDEVANFEL